MPAAVLVFVPGFLACNKNVFLSDRFQEEWKLLVLIPSAQFQFPVFLLPG